MPNKRTQSQANRDNIHPAHASSPPNTNEELEENENQNNPDDALQALSGRINRMDSNQGDC